MAIATEGVEALPQLLYSAEQVRALDRSAIEEHAIPGGVLMQRAGRAAFRALLRRWPEPGALHIFCGTGNNGGDGFVIAAQAHSRGLPVCVWQVGDAAKIDGDARVARDSALADGVEIRAWEGQVPATGVVVDALLGTGLGGEVRAPAAQAIAAIGDSGLPVLAVDIPSGLCSDTGCVLGRAVRADLTVTFIGLKLGLLTGAGPDFVGALEFFGLQVPAAVHAAVPASAERLSLGLRERWLPSRARTAHKGAFGHALVIGGDHGMAGAPAMAAQAAARVGAGLVSCATRPEHVSALVTRTPEIMARGVSSRHELEPMLARASVLVLGPGLGGDAWGQQLLQCAWECELPLVADADALNLIAAGKVVQTPRAAPWVMTPHPGEAARLLGVDTGQVQADRLAAVKQLAQRYQATVVLKGAGTLVLDPASTVPGLCPYGNPGMASGGMGDVLSGVIGGLLAQGLEPGVAAALGVCLHGAAADHAARAGERGLLATDLVGPLRSLVNGL